jgi:hypothetical protein
METMQSGVYYCESRAEWIVVFHGEDVETAPCRAVAIAKLDHLELEDEQLSLTE